MAPALSPSFPAEAWGPGLFPDCSGSAVTATLGSLWAISAQSPFSPPPPPFFVLFSPLQSFSILFWPCALQEGRVQFPPTPTPTLQPHGHTTDLGPPPTSSQHFFPLFVSVLFFKQSYLYCRFVTPQRWSAPGLLWGPLEITRVLLESAVSHCGFWAGWWRRRGVVAMGAMGAMGTCLRSA